MDVAEVDAHARLDPVGCGRPVHRIRPELRPTPPQRLHTSGLGACWAGWDQGGRLRVTGRQAPRGSINCPVGGSRQLMRHDGAGELVHPASIVLDHAGPEKDDERADRHVVVAPALTLSMMPERSAARLDHLESHQGQDQEAGDMQLAGHGRRTVRVGRCWLARARAPTAHSRTTMTSSGAIVVITVPIVTAPIPGVRSPGTIVHPRERLAQAPVFSPT